MGNPLNVGMRRSIDLLAVWYLFGYAECGTAPSAREEFA
jgi:hypothetical protein